MPDPTACLDLEEVDLFLRGDLDRASRDAREAHLADCEACRVLLSTLARLQTPFEHATPELAPKLQPRDGSQVGRYTIVDCLGAGGMAVVYRAHDPELARNVALKVLRADLVHPDRHALQERLRREAQAMAQVAHPNVMAVHDVGTWDDRVFIAMELVEGVNLSLWLAQAPRSAREVISVFVRAGRGLVAAHAAGLVHRDFKPANVMVGDDGRVRVGDFGLARAAMMLEAGPAQAPLRLLQAHSVTGSCAGTPYYMAPEQFHGEVASPRSDQFSFCVALHAALTGAHPVTGTRSEPPPAASAVLPRWLQRVLRRGLSAGPDDRYPSMASLLEAIERGASQRRRVALVAVCALAAVAMLLAVRPRDAAHATASLPDARTDELFLDAAELHARFAREWRALNTDACERPHAGCILQATNLLRDPSFWRASGDGAVLALRDGEVRLVGGALTQQVPWPVPPGRSYSFRVRVRVPPGQPPARGRVSLQPDGNGDAPSTGFLAGPAWAPVGVTFSSSAHHRGLRATVALDAPGQLEIDDGELVDAGLMDASFEDLERAVYAGRADRATAWRPYNVAHAVSLQSRATDAVDGSHVLEVQSTAVHGSFQQDTAQAPLAGNTYIFTAWLRAGSRAPVRGTLVLWALGKQPVKAVTEFTVGQRWTQTQVSLNVHASDHGGLRTELYFWTPDVPLQVDATSLLPAGLVDASFEDEPVRWITPAGALRLVSSAPGADDGAKDGDAWLRVVAAHDDDAIAQEVGAPASGATYLFSAWVRAPLGSTRAAQGRLVLRSIGGVPEVGATTFQATHTWTLITAKLAVRRDDHVGLRVELQLPDAGAQLDVDGTRLIGVSPPPRDR